MIIQFKDRKTGALIKENPPQERVLNLLYNNALGKLTLLPLFKRKFFSDWMGWRATRKSSVKRISGFVSDLEIDMTESVKTIPEFGTFNDFFFRKLKPEARPIGEGIISPGDGRLLAFEHASQIHDFFVKGRQFTLSEFLDDESLAEKHKDSALLILRLAPNDYHRFHFPYAGKASKTKEIKGHLYSVSPYALAKNFTTVFCDNKRELCSLTTPDKGEIILAPVGATSVGAILKTYTPDSEITKGDEMGYFAFGGSTIVILFEQGKVRVDSDLLENTKNGFETYVKMGETIAQ
jgi:phosphatidylserine decarboxylase